MNTLYNPNLLTVSEWALDLLDITHEDISHYIPDIDVPREEMIEFTIACSTNDSDVLSMLITMKYMMRKEVRYHNRFQSMIQCLSEDRFVELISMNVDVMRECVRLLEYRDIEASCLLYKCGGIIAQDSSSVERLISIALKHRWALTSDLVSIVGNSYSGWRFLERFNFTKNLTSKKILSLILKKSTSSVSPFKTLLSSNGSALEYLIHIDGSFGITLSTINRFSLWDCILSNPAAKPIIDFALERFHLVESGRFYSKHQLYQWMKPMLSRGPLAVNYITIEDVNTNMVSPLFFSNPVCVELIGEWVNDSNVNDTVVGGLVDIACSGDQLVAHKAVDILDGISFVSPDMIVKVFNVDRIISMLKSPHARSYAHHLLFFEELEHVVEDVLFMSGLVPYWFSCYGGYEEDDEKLLNLTLDTIKNIELDHGFRYMTQVNVHLLSYENWCVLLQTQFGVDLALENIGYVIHVGVLFELLKSPLVSKEMILELRDYTDAFEFAGDEECAALLSRPDIYEIDLKKVVDAKKGVCQEILRCWYEPERLIRYATSAGLDIRTYLNCCS